jgi:hypothetical protein
MDYPTPQPSPTTYNFSEDYYSKMMVKFNEKQADLVNIPEKSQPVKNPYYKEKVVFYTKGIHFGETDARWIFDSGPSDLGNLTAKNPEDVKTVVLTICKQVKSNTQYFVDLDKDGKKEKAINVFYWNCDLTIIDRTLSAVIFKKTFSNKPDNFFLFEYNESDKYELPLPTATVNSFLSKLPVK